MTYNKYLCIILLLMIISPFELASQIQKNDDAFQLSEEPEHKKWGIGVSTSLDRTTIISIDLIYRLKNSYFNLGYGITSSNELEYIDGNRRSKTLNLDEKIISAGWSIPIEKDNLFFFKTEVFYRWTRSEKVREWVSFDHLPYQKRFDLYHDVNIYGIQAGLHWEDDIAENFRIHAGFYPQLNYISFPEKRQSDPLYVHPVRKRIFDDKLAEDQKYLLSAQIRLGLSWYII